METAAFGQYGKEMVKALEQAYQDGAAEVREGAVDIVDRAMTAMWMSHTYGVQLKAAIRELGR